MQVELCLFLDAGLWHKPQSNIPEWNTDICLTLLYRSKKLDMLVQARNSRTWKVEARGLK